MITIPIIKETERLQKQAQNRYHQQGDKKNKKEKNIMKTMKKDCEIKHQINRQNYLIKKRIKKKYGRNQYRNMSEKR